MDGDVEILVAYVLERFKMFFGGMSVFIARDIEPDDTSGTEGYREFGDFQRQVGGLVPHGAKNQAIGHARLLPAPLQSREYGGHDFFKVQSFFLMKHRGETDFGIYHMFRGKVLDGFERDTFQGFGRLQYRCRDGEGLKIQGQAFLPAPSGEPVCELLYVMCGQFNPVLVCQLDDRAWSESTVQMIV